MKRKDPKFRYKHAMLVDDNELDNFINQKILESNYFANKVYINTGAVSALEFLCNLTISGAEITDVFPEVIFIDINMPMMNGFQFIEHLKNKLPKQHATLKLIILTSSDDPSERVKAEAIDKEIIFLNKPLTGGMLVHI